MEICTRPVGVYDITPFTQLDYPGELACIIWFAGCNLRCKFCHNPDMVRSVGEKPWEEVYQFLKQRKGKLTGVVFSGGEATLNPHIVEYARMVKALGFKLKLDSNGSRPQTIKTLLDERLVDMIAMDYKAPRARFKHVTRMRESLWDAFSTSLDMLIGQDHTAIDIRTTVHTHLLNEADIAEIEADLARRGFKGTYYVQNYRHAQTLGQLPAQAKTLDHALIRAPQRVHIDFRNFG